MHLNKFVCVGFLLYLNIALVFGDTSAVSTNDQSEENEKATPKATTSTTTTNDENKTNLIDREMASDEDTDTQLSTTQMPPKAPYAVPPFPAGLCPCQYASYPMQYPMPYPMPFSMQYPMRYGGAPVMPYPLPIIVQSLEATSPCSTQRFPRDCSYSAAPPTCQCSCPCQSSYSAPATPSYPAQPSYQHPAPASYSPTPASYSPAPPSYQPPQPSYAPAAPAYHASAPAYQPRPSYHLYRAAEDEDELEDSLTEEARSSYASYEPAPQAAAYQAPQTYDSPPPQVQCPHSLLAGCQPTVATVPCSSPPAASSY